MGRTRKGMAADRHSPAALPCGAEVERGWRIISANSITPLWLKAARRKKPSAGRWRAWETVLAGGALDRVRDARPASPQGAV